MKKTFVFLALAAVSLAACTREELNPEEQHPVVKTVLTVGTAQTKTTLGDAQDGQRQLYWANGDMINVNGVNSAELAGLTANTATSADFSFVGSLETPYKALYPASIYKNATTVTLPHNAGNQVIPLGGVSESTPFSLSPLTSMLLIKIKQAASEPDTDNITLIEVSTESTRMSGEFTIDDNYTALTPAASPSGDDLKVQITGNWTLAAEATNFFIPVPAGEYSFTVKVMDSKGHYMTKSTTSAKEFTAGSIKPLKEFAFEPDQEGGLEIDSPEALIAFAKAYNRGDYAELGRDLVATVTADLTFDATTSAAFNATGGIGAGGSNDPLFNGVFDGGNHSINGLAATVPLFARVGQYGTVKNVVMGSSSSHTHSDAISANTYVASIAGYCKGNITGCTNNAPVTCSSTTRSAGVIYMGGIVARQNQSGTVSSCENNGAVTCSTLVGSDNVYVGGIMGTVERPGANDTALIEFCSNYGAIKCGVTVKDDPAQAYKLHMAGVVGWLYSTSSSAKMIISGLSNYGDVTKTQNSDKANGTWVLLGGIVAGIHGAGLGDASGKVEIKDSHVANCSIQNGNFNNNSGYDTATHTGGFVGLAKGGNKDDIVFNDNCEVRNVEVICYRAFAGGFASCVEGTTITDCNVLSSSVKGSLAQLRRGGGLVGYSRGNVTLKDCIVTLTKDSQYSLYGATDTNNDVFIGGIVGATANTNAIDGCKAYIRLMYVGTHKAESGDSHGWILGNGATSTTIKNCGLGGTFGKNSASITLTDSNFSDYICGAGSTADVKDSNFYWDGSDAPVGKTVSITIQDYATSNGWTSGTQYSTISKGDLTLTASQSGTSKNGFYFNDVKDWRFYQARGGGLTVSVPEGRSLIRAKFIYDTTNTGVLKEGSNQVLSGTTYALSGTSAFFTVGNTGTVTNGQVRITKIVIEYE